MTVKHDNEIGSYALIDSGSSDETYIPRYIAKDTGLLSKGIKKAQSVSASGKFDVYRTRLKQLRIMKNSNVFDTFRDIIVRIPTESVRDLPFVVLGRNTIFKRYDITFSEKRKKITLARFRNVR